MSPGLWTEEILQFSKNLTAAQIRQLPFQKPVFPGIENRFLVEQALCYQKSKSKLPSWWEAGHVVFPDKVAVEQCSSEWTAQWKAKQFGVDGMQLVDVCAGLGVDTYWLGQNAAQVLAFETEAHRRNCLEENLKRLSVKHFRVFGQSFLEAEMERNVQIHGQTLVYADPDRRVLERRESDWRESSPSLDAIYERVKQAGARLLVKLSPLDQVAGLLEILPGAHSVWVVSLHNEVKEILVYWDLNQVKVKPEYHAVELDRKDGFQSIVLPEKQGGMIETTPVKGGFLLDPWAAMRKDFRATGWMQANGFSLLSEKAQFFYATEKPLHFPGRIFQIKEIVTDPKAFASRYRGKPMQVLLRHFPENAEVLKKKWGFAESETQFLIGYKNAAGRKVFLFGEKWVV